MQWFRQIGFQDPISRVYRLTEPFVRAEREEAKKTLVDTYSFASCYNGGRVDMIRYDVCIPEIWDEIIREAWRARSRIYRSRLY